jgi:hypothetical protein
VHWILETNSKIKRKIQIDFNHTGKGSLRRVFQQAHWVATEDQHTQLILLELTAKKKMGCRSLPLIAKHGLSYILIVELAAEFFSKCIHVQLAVCLYTLKWSHVLVLVQYFPWFCIIAVDEERNESIHSATTTKFVTAQLGYMLPFQCTFLT